MSEWTNVESVHAAIPPPACWSLVMRAGASGLMLLPRVTLDGGDVPEAVSSFGLQGRATSRVCTSYPEGLLEIILQMGRLRPRWRRVLLGSCSELAAEPGLEPGSPAP